MESTSRFSILPDNATLDDLQRQFAFRPADPHHSVTLTERQISHYNSQGFISPLQILTPHEAADLRGYFDNLLEQTLAAGRSSYSISTAHLKHGRVYDVLTDSRIINVVADLLGDNVVAWGSHFFCKLPGDSAAVAWHQDSSYWPLSPSHAVTVWLAIDDADVDNGCMRFIPGSHHSGHLTWRESTPEEHNVLNQTVENAESYGTGPIVDNILRAGQASLHSDLLLHGSAANCSTRRRCGLTLRYTTTAVRAGMNWNEKGIVVRGSDASGHWKNPPRPTAD